MMFEDYLSQLDRKNGCKKNFKKSFFKSMCSSLHTTILIDMKDAFILANFTQSQPLDLGIIHAFKLQYTVPLKITMMTNSYKMLNVSSYMYCVLYTS